MRVFVTGATGWIGSATVDELVGAGHEVVGLARTDEGAAAVERRGATALRGDLDDLDSLRAGTADADAVIHLANKHDWANPAESNRAERVAVQTFMDAMEGSDRRFVFASGVAGLTPGRPTSETDASPFSGPESMRGSENLALDYVERGVHSISARFAPTVHGLRDHGFIAAITAAARRQGVSGYVGDGTTSWSAVHRSDAARLVRLGLEQADAGARLHAVAEEAVPSRDIAEAIGRRLGVPAASIEEADAIEHFGFIGRFFAMNLVASSELTRQRFDWKPTGPTLLEDIAAGAYDTP